ncbi:hypothetical protein Tco_1579625, partial [Tanacetum coccineum]
IPLIRWQAPIDCFCSIITKCYVFLIPKTVIGKLSVAQRAKELDVEISFGFKGEGKEEYIQSIGKWVPKLNNQRKDETKWKDNKGNLIDYSSKAAWEAINSQSAEFNWNKVVWKGMPGYSKMSKKTTMKMIIENIGFQLMGLKVKRSPKVQGVAMEWEVQMNYK